MADVDTTYGRAVAAGATGLHEPGTSPTAPARAPSSTCSAPWIVSQRLEALPLEEYARRAEGSGFRVRHGRLAGQPYVDGIWTSVAYRDVDAGIRFLTEVLGFDEQVMVRGEDGAIVHSEYRWPEGGIVQVAGADDESPFVPEPGTGGFYVVTADPHAVWARCQAAGVEVLRQPEEPHYDTGGMGFSVRDAEGDAWSFGTYAAGATT